MWLIPQASAQVLDVYQRPNDEQYPVVRAKAILDKIEFVFTPKHGSWLNMAEIEFSVLTRQAIRGRIADKQLLAERVEAWQQRRNQE